MPFAQQIEKLRLDGPAGIGPDVLVIPNDQLGSAVVQGLLSPLTLDAAQQAALYPVSDGGVYSGQGGVWRPESGRDPGADLQQRSAAGPAENAG